MGRVTQAMRRARESGIATELEPLALNAADASALASEPFPEESVQEPPVPAVPAVSAVPEPPKAEESSGHDDLETQRLFFNTYPEKVWRGPNPAQDRLLGLLAKVERHRKLRFGVTKKNRH